MGQFLRRFFGNSEGLGGAIVQRLGIAISDDFADEATHPTITAGSGVPTSSAEPAGSLYIRYSSTVGIYQYRSAAWVLVVGMGSDFGATGIKADVVAESTSAAGVTVDGTLIKDGVVTANLTGNVTGNTSGSSGSCTGNAATATAASSLASGAVFLSAEVTGNGASQDAAHGLGATPVLVLAIPSDLTGGAYTVAYGTHDATNAKVTVTTGEKYRVVAFK